MIFDVWLALIIVILAGIWRLFYKGSLICLISIFNFSLIVLIYYSDAIGFEYYLLLVTNGAVTAALIGVFCTKDLDDLKIYRNFAILIAVTACLDALKAFGLVDNISYLYLGRLSTIIQIFLTCIGFCNVRGTGFLNNIKTNHAFFHTWSCYYPHLKINKDRKIKKNDIRRTKP